MDVQEGKLKFIESWGLLATHWGINVIDGDKHDDVSADPRGSIRMLSWKGPRDGLDDAGVFAERIRNAN